MASSVNDARRILDRAAQAVGIDPTGAKVIRDGANVLYELPGRIVARVGRPGEGDVAEREVSVSRWLEDRGISVVHALHGVDQAVVVDRRPVTWWRLLPRHRAASPAELGSVLRKLHDLAVPDIGLTRFDPFHGIDAAELESMILAPGDHAWLVRRVDELRQGYQAVVETQSRVIHGDAWQGNVAVADDGEMFILDLESVALGPPDIDLVPLAVDYTDFARLARDDYASFVAAYGGYDVTESPGYRVLADIQELRWLWFLLGKSGTSPGAHAEAQYRLRCLRGEVPRPWTWSAF
ncbi:aminoglycoside phosphotransferase family protein [Spiractinospora alimapuensis]|uniref:phosphotransferase family protein n=1 Tax=Spiractinospora alimapuensis TaxID=2820884 RepID=UPI001F3FE9CE|nr:aminoglycoside phosphotransferase family protein [Spiractinospora alimapuensis]QVQ51095.1 aminoglycoside phosphotransferase family protein [Spiractinospora alimapuensis]